VHDRRRRPMHGPCRAGWRRRRPPHARTSSVPLGVAPSGDWTGRRESRASGSSARTRLPVTQIGASASRTKPCCDERVSGAHASSVCRRSVMPQALSCSQPSSDHVRARRRSGRALRRRS
jgi:hypothetical protein